MINQQEVKVIKTGKVGRVHFIELHLEDNCNYAVEFNYKEIDKVLGSHVKWHKGSELSIL